MISRCLRIISSGISRLSGHGIRMRPIGDARTGAPDDLLFRHAQSASTIRAPSAWTASVIRRRPDDLREKCPNLAGEMLPEASGGFAATPSRSARRRLAPARAVRRVLIGRRCDCANPVRVRSSRSGCESRRCGARRVRTDRSGLSFFFPGLTGRIHVKARARRRASLSGCRLRELCRLMVRRAVDSARRRDSAPVQNA